LHITNAGILAVIGQRRSSIATTPRQTNIQPQELQYLDLRKLPHLSQVVLGHLFVETPYLRTLAVDITLLRTKDIVTPQPHANTSEPYSWSLTQLQLLRQLEHLVVDASSTANHLYGESAPPWWYISNSLPYLKVLTLIGRWSPPEHEIYESEVDWGWSMSSSGSRQTVLPMSLSVTTDVEPIYHSNLKDPSSTLNPAITRQFSRCRDFNPRRIRVQVLLPSQAQQQLD
jgi:hypothetical protein